MSEPASRPPVEPVKSGVASRAFAAVVVALRFLVVPAVVAGAFLAWNYLPGIGTLPESGVGALLPQDTAAARAEEQAAQLFGSSLLPRIAVVQRDPDGLSLADQKRIASFALRLDRGELRTFPKGSRALPYLNTVELVPGARERSTTAITYLGFPDSVNARAQRNYAYQYARAVSLPSAPANATGFLPGELAQSDAIDDSLQWVEIATILVVAIILALYLRSVLAPLVTLAAAGLAYLIATGVVGWLADAQGVAVQNEVEPIIVVLLLGVVTDYSVFFLSGMRGRLRSGEEPRPAARRATAQVVPIIVTAALLVAAGLATLRLAGIGFIRALGPAMAAVVLVSVAVSITFVPAMMGILGRALFWPGLRPAGEQAPLFARFGAWLRQATAGATSRRWLAVPTVVVVVLVLVGAATGLGTVRLALTPIRSLEGGTPPARGASDAALGFAPGMIAPTEIVLRAPGIGLMPRAQLQLARELAADDGVGAVVGPRTAPLPREARFVFRTRTNDAIRYFVALRDHPYGSAAIDDFTRLRDRMPDYLQRAGLANASVLYAGDTALARETTNRVHRDLVVVGLVAAAVNLLLLALFLRALVAPILLLASSLLGLAATFGVMTYVFQDALGTPDLTYYVPLAVGVLLLSFGTDYNLFVVGRIWQEAEEHDMSTAIREAVPRASRAISIAGLALAFSFAMLAIVPITPFRELAFGIGLGVIVDTFLVRTILIPALLSTFGERSWWPGSRFRRRE